SFYVLPLTASSPGGDRSAELLLLMAAMRLQISRILGVGGGIHGRHRQRRQIAIDVHERENAVVRQSAHSAVPADPLNANFDADRSPSCVHDAAHEVELVAHA